MEDRIQDLRRQVDATRTQLRDLESQLEIAKLEAQFDEQYGDELSAERADAKALQSADREIVKPNILQQSNGTSTFTSEPSSSRWPLAADEYRRYGRQLIMPEVGLHGQLRLKNAKVLVVGVGGLGCPAAAYLAGAGVGILGLVDGDTVEISNLHRQIAHGTQREGMSKVDSACEYLQSLNPLVCYRKHISHLSPDTAVSLVEQYDLVLDCTDHPTSRYLISDACVLTGKPLVSASALKTEGQLMVLNNPPRPAGDTSGGPCYRCIFPKPPPADSVLSCGEGGILGPVVGVMGVLQALEAIKILTSKPKSATSDHSMPNGAEGEQAKPSLLMFSALSNPQFRTIRLRARRNDCAACSGKAWITKQSLFGGSLDYIAFCGMTMPVKLLPPHQRISATEFARMPKDYSNMLIDVRDETQFAICALPESINVPWTGNATSWLEKASRHGILAGDLRQKYLVCRVGNDSQLAAKAMMEHTSTPVEVKDIRGGFHSWRQEVDHEWPDY